MTTIPQLTGTSTLGLCPFVVKGRDDRYTVINREGRQAISTSRAGVEAIRLLAKGRTVERTKRILGDRYGQQAHAIDLAPLLETLFSSGFVRTLDGREIAPGREGARHGFRLWLALMVWSPLLELVLRHLPSRLALPLVYWWFSPRSNPELERRIVANLRRAPGLDLTERDVARIAAGHRRALRKQFCDRLLFTSLPPRRLRRWLSGGVRVSGVEHLARAGASGKGTILCSFHLGSYGLIPFVLGAKGVAVTVYAGFGRDARADVAAWLAERGQRGDAYPVRVIGGGMGLRALAHCLERGGTVLLYCDQPPGAAGSAPQDRSLIPVPFLGTRISSARGLGWLRRRTGATVLPVVLLWEGRGGHHLRIDPEIPGHAGPGEPDDLDTLTAVYGVLERYARQAPEQWLRWEDFGAMAAPEPSPPTRGQASLGDDGRREALLVR